MQNICILGRQPALGLAELESCFGPESIRLIQPDVALLTTDQLVRCSDFGGIIKFASIKDTFFGTEWNKIARHLHDFLPRQLSTMQEGKVTLGISVHNLKTSPKQINATALSLKKVIRQTGRSARIVPNNEITLNSAQVLHNKLTQPNGIELVLVRDGATTFIAKTTWIQDIEAYAKRDQGRPARDARVGMLPPKLAQIIINLATQGKRSAQGGIVLDPFCGTGVVLQEALLMEYEIQGTDLDARMVEYTKKNLEWFGAKEYLEWIKQGDATNHDWHGQFDYIACETYLGRPFSHEPDPETLTKVIHDVNIIHKKFLQNVARQTQSGFRMCIAVPAWHTKSDIKHLPVLDQLDQIAYNRVSFVHAKQHELIYHRENQIVGRELVILIRK